MPRNRKDRKTRANHDSHEKTHDSRRETRRAMQQNFLRHESTARKIVRQSGVGPEDTVVELGAGDGMLTLSRSAGRVLAVEQDPRWAAHLKRRFAQDERMAVVHADALCVDLPEEPFRVVANVPFYITTEIMHRLLDDPTTPPKSAHLLAQEEVARKHASVTPTTLKTLRWSPWHRLSATLKISASSFHPKPRVNGGMLVAVRREDPLVPPRHRDSFRAFTRLAFEGKGRVVGKTLRPVFTRAQLRKLAKDLEFPRDAAPSRLTVDQWSKLFAFMVEATPRKLWPAAGRPSRRKNGR